jgi:hypothetical protein
MKSLSRMALLMSSRDLHKGHACSQHCAQPIENMRVLSRSAPVGSEWSASRPGRCSPPGTHRPLNRPARACRCTAPVVPAAASRQCVSDKSQQVAQFWQWLSRQTVAAASTACSRCSYAQAPRGTERGTRSYTISRRTVHQIQCYQCDQSEDVMGRVRGTHGK